MLVLNIMLCVCVNEWVPAVILSTGSMHQSSSKNQGDNFHLFLLQNILEFPPGVWRLENSLALLYSLSPPEVKDSGKSEHSRVAWRVCPPVLYLGCMAVALLRYAVVRCRRGGLRYVYWF